MLAGLCLWYFFSVGLLVCFEFSFPANAIWNRSLLNLRVLCTVFYFVILVLPSQISAIRDGKIGSQYCMQPFSKYMTV